MYRRKSPEWIRHLDFEVLDLICMLLYFIIIDYVRFQGRIPLRNRFADSILPICMTIFLVNAFIVFIMHPYRGIIQRNKWKELQSVFSHFTIVHLMLIAVFYLQHNTSILPRLSMLIQWAGSCLTASVIHLFYKRVIRRNMVVKDINRMVIFSDSRHIIYTYEQVCWKPYNPYNIIAIVMLDHPSGEIIRKIEEISASHKVPEIIDGIEKGMEYLRTQAVDDVLIDYYGNRAEWNSMIDTFLSMGTVVHIGLDIQFPNASVTTLGHRLAVTTTVNEAPSWQLTIKRIFDILGALVGLFFTGIIAIFLVPAIKLADPGPAFFSQERIGKNGRPFRFYKFRSMYMDAEERKAELMAKNEMNGLMFKMENDPRIIGSEKGPGKGIGNFIRKTSLDEFPQFWNVLKGDMSLVGTRPPTRGEYDQYDLHHKIRLSMKPGITGNWQISGRSNITDFEEIVKMDAAYIQNWNLFRDMYILLKTLLVVFRGTGSR